MAKNTHHLSTPERDLSTRSDSPTLLLFEQLWDKQKLAAFLGVTLSGLDKLIAAKKAPPGFRAGRLWRWSPSVVMSWAEQQEKSA
jgi:hypothetical protein